MAFCTECGTACANCAEETAAADAIDREVEIARINRKADVEIARIQAGAARDTTELITDSEETIAEIEAVAGVEAAEAVAEVLEDIVTPESEPAPEPAPVVIEDEPEPEPTIEPAESTPPRKESKGLWWE